MKRSFFAVLFVVIACLMIAGCGGSSAKELDIAAFASAAVEKVDFGEPMIQETIEQMQEQANAEVSQ